MLNHPHQHLNFGRFSCDIVEAARSASNNAKGRPMSSELAALPDFPGKELLSFKEGQVLALLVGECYTHKSIAKLLGIDYRTVETYVESCKQKLEEGGFLSADAKNESRDGLIRNRVAILTRHVFMNHTSPK